MCETGQIKVSTLHPESQKPLTVATEALARDEVSVGGDIFPYPFGFSQSYKRKSNAGMECCADLKRSKGPCFCNGNTTFKGNQNAIRSKVSLVLTSVSCELWEFSDCMAAL